MRTFKEFMEAKARLDTGETPQDIANKYLPPQPEDPYAAKLKLSMQRQQQAAQQQMANRQQLLKQNPPAV